MELTHIPCSLFLSRIIAASGYGLCVCVCVQAKHEKELKTDSETAEIGGAISLHRIRSKCEYRMATIR